MPRLDHRGAASEPLSLGGFRRSPTTVERPDSGSKNRLVEARQQGGVRTRFSGRLTSRFRSSREYISRGSYVDHPEVSTPLYQYRRPYAAGH